MWQEKNPNSADGFKKKFFRTATNSYLSGSVFSEIFYKERFFH